jgi:hypothetical protein
VEGFLRFFAAEVAEKLATGKEAERELFPAKRLKCR